MRLRLDLDAGPILARLDVRQFELVLLNLVRNADDAMPEGGDLVVGTRVLPAAEAASTLHCDSALEVFVSDTGAGMAPEILARATEVFFSTKANDVGTGLGLFLALELVHHGGGKLIFDSAPGRGTTARVIIPRLPDQIPQTNNGGG